jgi:uncharacterized membrane protein
MIWHRVRIPVIHQMRARPRLVAATAIAVAVGLLLPAETFAYSATRWLIAWNTLTVLYVCLASIMMMRSSAHQMCQRARMQDDGQIIILGIVALSAIASLAAIGNELAVVKDLHGAIKTEHIALTGLTVMSSWAFIQITFALHYAHTYYAAVDQTRAPGLRFPEDEQNPTYGDFFYFSAIIGTSGQTADVAFTTKPMRRIGTLHCILAYSFNTIVLALLINIAASLF